MINFSSTSTNAIITENANDHGQASVSEMVNFPSTSTNAIITDNANHHGQASVSEMVYFPSTEVYKLTHKFSLIVGNKNTFHS
jgi:hypothetical protein